MKINIYYTTLVKKTIEVDNKFKQFLEDDNEALLDELNKVIAENLEDDYYNVHRVEDFETGDCFYED